MRISRFHFTGYSITMNEPNKPGKMNLQPGAAMKQLLVIFFSYERFDWCLTTSKHYSQQQKKLLVLSYYEASTHEILWSLAHRIINKATIERLFSEFPLLRTTTFPCSSFSKLKRAVLSDKTKVLDDPVHPCEERNKYIFLIVFICLALVESCRKSLSPKRSFAERKREGMHSFGGYW